MTSDEVTIGRLDERLKAIENTMRSLVTRPEFNPVKMIAYGFAGSILMTVVGAVLSLILRK